MPPHPTQRVLGLDISSRFVGWALFEDLEPVAHGLLKLGSGGHGQRMTEYHEYLLQLFDRCKPTDVVLELPFAGRRRKTYGILIQYIAITLLAYYQHFGLELPDENKLQAREIKHLLRVPRGDNHDENKELMVDLINSMFRTSFRFDAYDTKKAFSEDDIADAYAVVWAWLLKYKHVASEPATTTTTKKKRKRRKTR